ncbi:MAG TPA: DUF4192 domain-containing protein [Propionibacteriaceae bacterium]|nr:DUF4192 domain-containing protein [Propionibacteriaceae bacterium]
MSRRRLRPRRSRPSTTAAAVASRTPRTRLRARGAPDLLALVPFQLGFHPTESLVTVLIRSGRVVLTARIDLPAAESAGATAGFLSDLVRQHRIEELVLFAYSDRPGPARQLLTGLLVELPAGLVNEALYVDGSRWWSMTCTDICCPAEGTPYDVTSHPLAAAAVFAGMSARADRRELAAAVSGPAAADLARLTALTDALRGELDELDDPRPAARLLDSTLRTAIADPATQTERTSATLALLVSDLQVRDLAWAMIQSDDAEEHVRVWMQVVSQVPPTLSAAPLALLGMAAWIAGDGALQNCCCDELARLHPQYSMGGLLSSISDRALSPKLWSALNGGLQAELRRELDVLAG